MYEITEQDRQAIINLLQQNILPRYIFINHGYPLEWACQIEEELKLAEQPDIEEVNE